MWDLVKRLFDNTQNEYNEILSNRVAELERLNESLKSENETLHAWLAREINTKDTLQETFFKRFGIIQEKTEKLNFEELNPIGGKRHVRDVIREMTIKARHKETPELEERKKYWENKVKESEVKVG